jgi:hypothetical protein
VFLGLTHKSRKNKTAEDAYQDWKNLDGRNTKPNLTISKHGSGLKHV